MREIKFRGKRLDNGEWIATYNYARVLDLERQVRAAGARQLKSVQLTIFETINEYERK